jgi:hypothetical protein
MLTRVRLCAVQMPEQEGCPGTVAAVGRTHVEAELMRDPAYAVGHAAVMHVQLGGYFT